MEPLVPNQTPIVGVPGIPVNTNVTLEDKNRNQEINNPDFNKLQVNMTIPTIPQSPPVNPTAAVDHPITLEDLAKGDNPVVTPQDIANGAIVVDGGTTNNNNTVNTNMNTNGGNIMNNNMNQQQMNNQQMNQQQYYQAIPQQQMPQQQYQAIPQQQMPQQQYQAIPQQQSNEEGGFFSSPTAKMVGVGVACAAAGYLGHKYMSASDSAEVAAALGELL